MIGKLNRLVDETIGLDAGLILLAGRPRSGKTRLLAQLAERREIKVLNVNVALGRKLLTLPSPRRQGKAASLLRCLMGSAAGQGCLLLDNIELLFDQTLKLDPLRLLKQNARSCCVVATWPGDVSGKRISYARAGHPEHREYGVAGLTVFTIE